MWEKQTNKQTEISETAVHLYDAVLFTNKPGVSVDYCVSAIGCSVPWGLVSLHGLWHLELFKFQPIENVQVRALGDKVNSAVWTRFQCAHTHARTHRHTRTHTQTLATATKLCQSALINLCSSFIGSRCKFLPYYTIMARGGFVLPDTNSISVMTRGNSDINKKWNNPL